MKEWNWNDEFIQITHKLQRYTTPEQLAPIVNQLYGIQDKLKGLILEDLEKGLPNFKVSKGELHEIRNTIKKRFGGNNNNDEYISKYLQSILNAETIRDKINVLNNLYQDGFEDGYNNKSEED